MRADAAVIVWTPATYPAERFGLPPGPRVAVLPYAERGTAEPRSYRMWVPAYGNGLGATKGLRDTKARRMEVVAMVFIHFHTLTVRDGIRPKMVHRAFLAIDEYRQHMSPDIPGAED